MLYLKLFFTFMKIGLFSVGGGYAAVPLIENEVVQLNQWLTANEFSDIIVIAEMTPGPIAINAATFVGIKLGGILGAIVCTIGCIVPSLIIVLILFYLYKKFNDLPAIQGVLKGLKPAIVALITSAGISILLLAIFKDSANVALFAVENIDFVGIAIFVVSFIILRVFEVNPIYLMMCAGLTGTGIYFLIDYFQTLIVALN